MNFSRGSRERIYGPGSVLSLKNEGAEISIFSMFPCSPESINFLFSLLPHCTETVRALKRKSVVVVLCLFKIVAVVTCCSFAAMKNSFDHVGILWVFRHDQSCFHNHTFTGQA